VVPPPHRPWLARPWVRREIVSSLQVKFPIRGRSAHFTKKISGIVPPNGCVSGLHAISLENA
jgi:hypothetical protein